QRAHRRPRRQDTHPMADRWHPDRSCGIFETLLVVDGEPVELEAHLRRLARSLDVVYSQSLPPQAEEELRQAAEDIPLGRLRLTAVPAEDGLQIDLLAEGVDLEAVFPSQGLKLRTHPVSGGLGPHKWVDRPGIDRPTSDGPGALIVDESEVLEAGWANVFAIRGGTLLTPPLDGRILPGTTRAALLELADGAGIETHESTISSDDLLNADETFLSGSIRGIEAALELDGQPLAGCGPLSRRLGDALRRRWGLTDDSLPTAAAAPRPDLLAR
ncbi:MAG TPA: aminotransferase class IV, partial [Solirubrobacterales bacterium]|nr:aminotransferase class IV [Solirubrobacterales bacterium]